MADLRQACDRCHDKKLRCPKPPGAVVCSRCAKANVPCIFSPPTRSLRSPGQDLGFDWSLLINSDQLAGSFLTPPLVNRETNQSPRSSEVAELIELMAALDLIRYEFPARNLDVGHISRHEVKKFTDEISANYDLQATTESVLQRAQQLVSLYPRILQYLAQHASVPASIDEACNVPDCMHRVHQSLQTRPQSRLDQATLNVLMACHIRYIDILENVMNHAGLCVHIMGSFPPDFEPQFDIPEIRIGSFVAPRGSAASMMTSMMIELHTSLTSRAKDLAKFVASVCEQGSREAKIIELQCEALIERSAAMLEDLQTLRSRLMALGLLR